MGEICRLLVLAVVATGLFSAPVWVPGWAKAAAEAEAEQVLELDVQPEDEWCSGATPDCVSSFEVWNSLPPSY